jgi:hypothetical protein
MGRTSTAIKHFATNNSPKPIEQACMPKMYAKCGFNRNTSRAVLAAPIELGGGGFTPLYVTAGACYVTHFLKKLENANRRYRRTIMNIICVVCISIRSILSSIRTSGPQIRLH